MAANFKKQTAPKISDRSKMDGLTLTQMAKITNILVQRSGDMLDQNEIAEINTLLSEPGSRSATMGAKWVPVNAPFEDVASVTDVDEKSTARASKKTKYNLANANMLGMVEFTDNTAMGRSDYGEYTLMKPQFVKARNDLRKRAVSFVQYGEEKNEEYTSKTSAVQINKPLVVDDNDKIKGDPNKKWTYEPWSQSQFIKSFDLMNNMSDRHLFKQLVPQNLCSDIPLESWMKSVRLSRKQEARLMLDTGLNRPETSANGNEYTPLNTMNIQRNVHNQSKYLLNYIQNEGIVSDVEYNPSNSTFVSKMNTGSGQYKVQLLGLKSLDNTRGMGSVSGSGIALSVDRTLKKTDFKDKYKVSTNEDVTAPVKVLLGKSNVLGRETFNLAPNESYKEFIHTGQSANTRPGLNLAAVSSPKLKLDSDGNRKWESQVVGLKMNRNAAVIGSDTEDVSLSEMVQSVNEQLEEAGLDTIDSTKDNGFDNLPLSGISQLYQRNQVIDALLKEGIDGEELRKDKYNGEVSVIMSDIAPLDNNAFTQENIDRISSQVDKDDDLKGSLTALDHNDLRVLMEVTKESQENQDSIYSAVKDEFYTRIGYKASVDDDEEDLSIDNESEDNREIDNTVSPLKEGLITSMAGHYVDNKSLRNHLLRPDEYTDGQKKLCSDIQEKIAKSIGIVREQTRGKNLTPEKKERLEQKYQDKLSNVHVVFDDQHVVHWNVVDEKNPKMLANNSLTGKPLKGEIGQIFLPNEDKTIDLDYLGANKGKAVVGYNMYVVTPGHQASIMKNENTNRKSNDNGLEPYTDKEMSREFLETEDGLPYRMRLSGFNEELDKRLDQTLARQLTLGIDNEYNSTTVLNKMYKGKDTYMTRITNDLVLSDKRLVDHLASRVHIDESYFSDAGSTFIGRKTDESGQLEDLSAKYTPESVSGIVFDETNIAGLGNSHFLSKGALEVMNDPTTYKDGRFRNSFNENSKYIKDLALNPNKRFGTLMNEEENKYHFADPTDRTSMAGNQQVHADSFVDNTHLALMTFKGYTMDDGSLITEKYAERVGREQAEMVADVRISQGDCAYLVNKKQSITNPDDPKVPEGSTFTPELTEEIRNNFIETMATTSTQNGGFKLAPGDKLSTFHGNKTIISHVISEEEMQPGKKFEMFGQNPDLEVVMPPESIISRLNMGEVQELMAGERKPVVLNDDVVGYQSTTRMINTEIKAVNKTHAYGPGEGRHVGAQLLWMLNARSGSEAIIDGIYDKNGAAVLDMTDYMEVTGVSVDPKTGIMKQGLRYDDNNLADKKYLKEHNIKVIDPSNPSPENHVLPKEGGYMKLPEPVHLPNMDKDQTTSYLPILPEKLRQGQELANGTILEQDRTKRYMQLDEFISKKLYESDNSLTSRNSSSKNVSTIQNLASNIADEITRAKLGGVDGAANKVSHVRRKVMGATVDNSATALATNNPEMPLDTIEVGPDVYKTLNLQNKDQKVLMWRDPALHAGSVMAFNVVENKNISGVGMNPVIATPFGGDFDGDTYGIYAPRDTPEVRKVLDEEFSVEAYLKDMGKKIEDRQFVMTDVELNTGMDFTAGAVKSEVKNSNGEPIKNKKMLEEEIRTILERGAYDPNSNISKDIDDLWRESQSNNIGADKIDLRSRETVKNSMIDIAKIGAKGKVELDDEGHVTNLKGLQQNLDRFDRLGYYDATVENRVYDSENNQNLYSDKLRNSVHAQLNERYAAGYTDSKGKVPIINNEDITEVAKADRDIEKATVAKQLLTATSGQSAIDLNKTAMDIREKQRSSRISETTQILTQAALQVKHEAAVVPSLNKGLATLSQLTNDGGETKDDYLAKRQEVFNEMGMPEGYSRAFHEAAFEVASENILYGDNKGGVEMKIQPGEHPENVTRSKSEVTAASAPLSLLAYNGSRYLKDMAHANRSIYEGEVSGRLAQALPEAYNKRVPEIDQVNPDAGRISRVYFEQNKQIAQNANCEVRDAGFEHGAPLVRLDDLAKIRPSSKDVSTVIDKVEELRQNEDVRSSEDAISTEDLVRMQFGRTVATPAVQVPSQQATKSTTRSTGYQR